jgi:hypothetical protein
VPPPSIVTRTRVAIFDYMATTTRFRPIFPRGAPKSGADATPRAIHLMRTPVAGLIGYASRGPKQQRWP